MNRTALSVLALVSLLGFGPGAAQAEPITFDDLPVGQRIPANYGGLTWSRNWNVINAAHLSVVPVSPPNVLLTADGNATEGPAWVKLSSPGTFTFVGADFAGLDPGITITASGYRNGNPVYNASFTISNNTFSFEKLDFQNIDALWFSASQTAPPGVIPAPAYLIDNFTTGSGSGAQTAPEPGSLLLFGIGLAGTGLAAVRGRLRKPSRD